MKFFYSPGGLFSLITKRKKYAFNDKIRDVAWYFSDAGREAYDKADTLAKKALYFYDYLSLYSENKTEERKGFLSSLLASFNRSEKELESENNDYKMALFLAEAVTSKALRINDYTELLDVEGNLFLNIYFKIKRFDTACFLAAIERAADADLFCLPENFPYKRITYCSKDKITDFYKLERLIITIGGADTAEKLAVPYLHNFNSAEVK